MPASESPFESYKSKRILIFVSLLLSFRTQSAKKLCLRFAIFYRSEKIQNIFEIGLKKMIWSDRTKIALGEKIFRKKKFADKFLLFIWKN